MFRRMRRNAAGKLVVFFIDEQGKEISPDKLGDYQEIGSESPNFGDTVEQPAAPVQQQGGGWNYENGSPDNRDSQSTNNYDTFQSATKGNLLEGLLDGKLGFIDKLFGALGIDLSDDTPATTKQNAQVAATKGVRATPVLGNVAQANPDGFVDDNSPLADTKLEGPIMQAMMEAGATPSIATAFLNVMRDVSGLDPQFTQQSAVLNLNNDSFDMVGYGLLGWDSDRTAKLGQFAKALGQDDLFDPITQAKFAVEEGKPNSPYMNPGTVQVFQEFANNPSMEPEALIELIRTNAVGQPAQQVAETAAPAPVGAQWLPESLTTPRTGQPPVSGTTPLPPVQTAETELRPWIKTLDDIPEWVPSNGSGIAVNAGEAEPTQPTTTVESVPPQPVPVPPMQGPVSAFAPNVPTTPEPEATQPASTPAPVTPTPDQGTIAAETQLVRPTGEIRPATIRDQNASPPPDWRPNVMDEVSDASNLSAYIDKAASATTQIPVDRFGLPAPSVDIDLAMNPASYPQPSRFIPNQNIIKDVSPSLIGQNNDVISGPIFGGNAGPREEPLTSLGVGQSWVPGPGTSAGSDEISMQPAPESWNAYKEFKNNNGRSLSASASTDFTDNMLRTGSRENQDRPTQSNFAPSNRNDGGGSSQSDSDGGSGAITFGDTPSNSGPTPTGGGPRNDPVSEGPTGGPVRNPSSPQPSSNPSGNSPAPTGGGPRDNPGSGGPTGGPVRGGGSKQDAGFMKATAKTVPSVTYPGEPLRRDTWAPWGK